MVIQEGLRYQLVRPLVTVLACLLLFGGAASAVEIGDASKVYSQAERSFFNGKVEEADALLRGVEEAMKAAQSGDEDAQKKANLLRGKVDGLRKKIDSKLGRTGKSGAGAASPSAAATDAGKASSPEISSGAKGRIGQAKRFLDSGLKAVAEAGEFVAQLDSDDGRLSFRGRMSQIEGSISSVEGELELLESRNAGQYPEDYPDLVAVREGLDRLRKENAQLQAKYDAVMAQAEQAAGAAQAASDVWIGRLKPLVTGVGRPGYDEEKYFVGSYTEEKEEMARRSRIYMEAKTAYQAYTESEAASNPTEELQRIIRDLTYNIEGFEESTRSAATSHLDEARSAVAHLQERAQAEAKKIGTDELPLPASKFALEQILRSLDLAKRILPDTDAGVRDVEAQYAALLDADAKLREARIAETRMIAEKFGGSGADEIKAKALEVVAKDHPAAKVLRTTIISEDWNEENVVEWTDTTRTALKHRITHSVTVQVGAKNGNECRIYTVHVAKDRKSTGGWTPMRAHVIFEDPILEENVNK